MRRNAFQLSRAHKATLYAVTLLVLVSGLAWQALEWFAVSHDEFGGATKHPAEAWMLRAHGAGAMLILVVLGTLLPSHVKRAWQARQNLFTGLGLLAFMALLTLTGYGLYYSGNESLRALTSSVHWWLGVLVPVALIAHVWRGHWLRRQGRLRHAATTPRPS